MTDARILIVEDDPSCILLVKHVLSPFSTTIDAAQTLTAARDYLEQRYYNVAIVDLNLRSNDPQDSQGMEFLALLQSMCLGATVRSIVFSAYGDMARVRDAFHDYNVVDFLNKAPVTEYKRLREAVRKALEANDLSRPLAITIAGGAELRSLWAQLQWAQREDPTQLEPEFYDLLRRLFPKADHLFIRPLTAGQSGAAVLMVEPRYSTSVGEPLVIKFGKRDKILREYHNYEQYVEPYASTLCSTLLHCVTGRALGAITYKFIGAEMGAAINLDDAYHRYNGDALLAILENLFRKTCARWYDNRQPLREQQNLIEVYSGALGMDWDGIWATVAALGIDLDAEFWHYPDLPGHFVNPKQWLEKRKYQIYLPIWFAVTHGDLNAHNILVTAPGDCWLIDFYRTGYGHILRDVVELETSLKFDLTHFTSLTEFWEVEARLLAQSALGKPVLPKPSHSHHKLHLVLGRLRQMADLLTGASNTIHEYNVSLLLTTLNLLRLDFLHKAHPAALLSAALLCAWLDEQRV